MKKLLIILSILLLLFGCSENNNDNNEKKAEIPTDVLVDIPSAIAGNESDITGTRGTELKGSDIYSYQRVYIGIAENSAEIIKSMIEGIKDFPLENEFTTEYQDNEDGSKKTLDFFKNPESDENYEYGINIYDSEKKDISYENLAFQFYWSQSIKKGIVTFHFNKMNHNITDNDLKLQVVYSEESNNYDREMEVFISGLSVVSERFNCNIRMFAGKKGNIIDSWGSSYHPLAWIVNSADKGRNWMYRAKADKSKNAGVLEVAIPPVDYDESAQFTEYPVKEVLKNEITQVYEGLIDSTELSEKIDEYLVNAEAPGYFKDNTGFVSGGENPDPAIFTPDLADLSVITIPFTPKDIKKMTISFLKQ